MDRLQKKCLIGSTCMHGFLALLLLVGAAFFVPTDKKPEALPHVRIVPSILIDKALAGGGGNPNVAKTDDQRKGDTTVPPKPPQPKPVVQQAPPKPQEQVTEPPKPKPQKPDPLKEAAKAPVEKPKEPALALKPTTRTEMQKKTAKDTAAADAEAKRRTELAQKIAKQLGGVENNVRAGFKGGTKMEVWGPGGEAYAGYEAFVQAVYDDAWETSHLMDQDGVVRVSVTIRRTGDVISAYITKGSGTGVIDKSVQRALDKVKFVAPFPAGTKDEQRTFNITFDLKAKRLIG